MIDLLTLAQDVRVLDAFGTKWSNQNTMNPLGAGMTGAAALFMLLLPRRWAILPLIFLACFVATAQRIVVGGLDFNILRILVAVGFVRVAMRREASDVSWNRLDALVLGFSVVRTAMYTLQHMTPQALIFQLGMTFDTVGLYFLMRVLLRTRADIVRAIVGFVLAAAPVCAFFALEKSTGRNMFSVFGGVPAVTAIREGRLRCQGAFSHPIIAGCFWASVLPLMGVLWFAHGWLRLAGLVGIACVLAIVFFCASSTPVAGVLAAGIGAAFYVLRRRMFAVRLAAGALLVLLHFVMEAPVWHLISRVSLAQGSTSYFRFRLIDSAIHRFDEWALIGTSSTAHWFWGAQDITNHYILEGVRGGALSLMLFIAIIAVAFAMVGRVRMSTEGQRLPTFFVWALGVSLFVHCINFLGVSYFGQAPLVWFFTLAAVASTFEQSTPRVRAAEPAPPRGFTQLAISA
ncbi:MAG: hypothetical protein SFY69_11790 [Planctomycetota bacterium]|nr:hypothetical protein [Planctomycetota bacterium]